MVQRKVHDQKLGIQAEDTHKKKFVKSSSSYQLEMRNKAGAELKKLMKKSGSFMASQQPSRRAKPRLENPSKALPKLCHIKTSDGSSPNYMKSTSSSTARKEGLQVTSNVSNGSKTGSDLKTQGRIKGFENRPEISSGSVKTLTKTSSLKPVRTLTKSSSMKKKSCRVGLCTSDQNVERATCSSTLKDSKFPKYVTLNPGGTEAEGTSVMKVCPYTYCSLNGHHHQELPRLKRFVSARRRLMKTQKAGRLKSVTPLEIKPSDHEERNKDIDTGQMMEQINLDFFVQIYALPREENGVESMDKLAYNEEEEEKMGTVVDLQDVDDGSFSVEEGEETKRRNNGWGEGESLSEELSCSELSFEGDVDRNCDLVEAEIEVIQKEGIDESCPAFEQADMEFEGYSFADDVSFDGPVVSEFEESKSELGYMDWEDEQYEASCFGNEADNISVTDDESNSVISLSLHQSAESELSLENTDVEDNNAIFDEGSFYGHDSELHSRDQILEIDLLGDLSSDALGEVTSTKEENDAADNKISTVSEEPIACDEDICGASELSNAEYMEPVEEQVCNSLEDEQEMDESATQENSEIVAQTEGQLHDLENVGDDAAGEEKVENSNPSHETENFVSSQVASDNVEDSANESQCDVKEKSISSSNYAHEQNDMEGFYLKSFEKDNPVIDGKEMEAEKRVDAEAEDMAITADEVASAKVEDTRTNAKSDLDLEMLKSCTNSYKPNRIKRPNEDSEELRKLNWQEPHYLPMESDLESEKVELKHQMMEERKNSEEWMLDYALRQTVNKLAPARKKKVALLVEAFEMVAPLPKWENRLQHTATPFGHTRFVQACN